MPATKTNGQRRLGTKDERLGARVPRARFLALLRPTDSPFLRKSQ